MVVKNNIAYVVSATHITQCTIAGDGSFSSCIIPSTPSGGWNLFNPVAIAVLNNILYVTNVSNSPSLSYISQCTLVAGSITSCSTPPTPSGGWNLLNPRGIAIFNNILYIPNYDSSVVTQCNLDGSGSISSCAVTTPSGGWNLNKPRVIAIANSIAYIVNGGGTITQCTIDGSGSITSCVVPSTPSGGWQLSAALGIAIVNNIAYMSNFNTNVVTQCTINGSGSITSCSIPATPSGGWNLSSPQSILFL